MFRKNALDNVSKFQIPANGNKKAENFHVVIKDTGILEILKFKEKDKQV